MRRGALAQLVEQLTLNQPVTGSSPVRLTIEHQEPEELLGGIGRLTKTRVKDICKYQLHAMGSVSRQHFFHYDRMVKIPQT